MHEVIWSERSVRNLKSIHEYIADDSPLQADRVVTAIIESAEGLRRFPLMGHPVPELPKLGLRQLIKYSFRIIYSVQYDRVNIIAVIHGRQDFVSTLRRQD